MDNIEWEKIFNQFYPKKLDYNKNKHLFTKVAFGCFQLNSSPVKSLWVLEEDEAGNQYLAAAYDQESETIEVKGDWNTLTNKEASAVVLYYKDFPIQKFSAQEYGFNEENIQVFQKLILKKAGEDKFVKDLIESQNKEKQEVILQQFPELNK